MHSLSRHSLSSRPRRTRRRGYAIVALLLAPALAAGVLLLTATGTAASPHRLRTGLGVRVHGGDFVGFYVTSSGAKVYCLDPDLAAPTHVSLSTTGRYRRHGEATTTALAYALARWGDAHTKRSAAVESQVLNTLVGNTKQVARRARHLPAAVGSWAEARVRLARERRGPYSVQLSAAALVPGQSAQAMVRVVSGSGHPVPGVRIRLRHSSNAAAPHWVRTGTDGTASFRYSVTGAGRVHLTATGRALPSSTLAVSHPKPGRQHMVSWVPRVRVRASASFTGRMHGFSNSYACTSSCAGRPVTTLRACAKASSYERRLDFELGGHVESLDFRPDHERRCRSLSVRLRDGDRVSAVWRFRAPTGWLPPVPARGTFVIDCPPVPAIVSSMRYDCTTAHVSVELARHRVDGTWAPLINRSTHQLVLVIGGARSERIVAGHGEGARFSAITSCRDPLRLTMRAGVQRANGDYNYGPLASLTTPGRPGRVRV